MTAEKAGEKIGRFLGRFLVWALRGFALALGAILAAKLLGVA